MSGIKIFFSLFLSLSLCTNFTFSSTTEKTVYVYICEGRYSKVYHKSQDCRGLSNCSTKIYKVTLEEALKMGRRPCKIEY